MPLRPRLMDEVLVDAGSASVGGQASTASHCLAGSLGELFEELCIEAALPSFSKLLADAGRVQRPSHVFFRLVVKLVGKSSHGLFKPLLRHRCLDL